MNQVKLGVALALAQQVSFAAETTLMHYAGTTMTLSQMALLRSLGGVLLVILLSRGNVGYLLKTKLFKFHVIRGLTSTAYLVIFIFSVTAMPVSESTAISYFSALYVLMFAPMILGETVRIRRWAIVGLGLCGVLLMVRPGMQNLSWIHIMVLFGTSLNGLAVVLTKLIERRDSSLSIMLYVNLIGLICILPFTMNNFLYLIYKPYIIVFCILGPVGQYLGIVAIRYADTSIIAPTTYARLGVASGTEWLFFGEKFDFWSVCGAAVITASCILTVFNVNGRFRSRRMSPDPYTNP